MNKEFLSAFQITRTTIFEVEYYTLGSNSHPYFTTSAEVFNRPKTDYNCCGECQKEVLSGAAYRFYKKWNVYHLKDLTESEYEEMMKDMQILFDTYNYIFYDKTKDENKDKQFISFYSVKNLSMLKVKK